MEMPETRAGSNPFPGLRPFGFDQRHLFFGRENQVIESLGQLRETRFLMVVGPSGSGKSSLINAGLIPGVYENDGAQLNWRTAVFRPGDDPIGNMASALEAPDVLGVDAERRLRADDVELAKLVQEADMPAGENLLLIVDQFEELFRFGTSSFSHTEAEVFVRLLLDAFCQQDCPIYVLLTMRADFLGRCTVFPGLPEAINDGQYLIPRMTPDQLRDAIVKPVGVGQADITSNLVERLLSDLEDNQDQLPIMQHALMRTWDCWRESHRNSEPIDESHYEAIGTIHEALSQHAEEAYAELQDDQDRRITEVLFKSLTDKSSNTRGARRPTVLSTVCDVAGADLEP